MTRQLWKSLGLTAIAACGPEAPIPPADLEEICGSPGPHRLLALAEHERPAYAGISRVGERWYFITGTGEGEPVFEHPQPATATVRATGPCGEDPVVVAEDVWSVFEKESMPGVLLGCKGSRGGDLVALDPSGATLPRLVAERGCDGATWTDHGIVRLQPIDERTVQVLFHPLPVDPADGPSQPFALLDEVRMGQLRPWLTVLADEVLALDGADNIVRVSLADGEVSIEQSGVLAFAANGRWLLWQDRASADEHEGASAADILIRDRETGDDTFLFRRVFPDPYVGLFDGFVVMYGAELDDVEVVVLPSFARLRVPEGHFPHLPVADGRWLTGAGATAPWSLVDLQTGESTLVANDRGPAYLSPDELRIHVLPYGNDLQSEGEVRRYRYDGSPPETLARRASRTFRWLSGGRLVSMVDVDEQPVGKLVVVERETPTERLIDDHVVAGELEIDGDDALVYMVRDGDRTGVWVARPAVEK